MDEPTAMTVGDLIDLLYLRDRHQGVWMRREDGELMKVHGLEDEDTRVVLEI